MTLLGFRIRGACSEPRRLVDWAAAFRAHCECDERAELDHEAYLSAFVFGEDFRRYLDETGSTKGYAGPCGSPWLWFDIDAGDDLERAQRDARRLAAFLAERYRLDGDELLTFFSGAKGFHVGVPLSLAGSPGALQVFHRTCRRLAERLAGAAGVAIDSGVYDRVRAFRAPNSRHPKTALHKRRLTFDELLGLSLDAVVQLAATPKPFDLPEPSPLVEQAEADWRDAAQAVERERATLVERRPSPNGSTRLNRLTLDFLNDGPAVGDRHRLLYSAARNLAELGCSPSAVHALLTEAALDCGLPPRDVRRQIDCGLADAGRETSP